MEQRSDGIRLGFRMGWLYGWHRGELFRVRGWPALTVQGRESDGGWTERDRGGRDALYERIAAMRGPGGADFVFEGEGWWESEGGQRCFPWALDEATRQKTWGRYGWERFLAALPERVRWGLEHIGSDVWSALRLVQEVPPLIDLAAHDRLLLAALARHEEFPAVGREAWAALREIAGGPRRGLLAWLGYAGPEALVNALRRHRVEWVDATKVADAVRKFLEVWRHPVYGPWLQKLPWTEADLITVLARPQTGQWLTGPLLGEFVRGAGGRVYRIAGRIAHMGSWVAYGLIAAEVGVVRAFMRASSIEQGAGLIDLVEDRALPEFRSLRGAGVEPISTVHDLIREGREMQSCVGGVGYVLAALRGEIAVFRVTGPVRATVALRCEGAGWTLLEIAGPRNCPVEGQEREQIMRGFTYWRRETSAA